MISCIFTIDYEIYGNGEGSLKNLVYEPAARLVNIFLKHNIRFVPFVEVAELEIIESQSTDTTIDSVKQQIRDFHNYGFELGLHLHPQWYNALHDNGKWQLDYSEYNLCILSQERITKIIDRSILYLRNILGRADYTPLSFRAGNWLFQPTRIVAKVLNERGIKIDSSVFKGGIQRRYNLDYRQSLRNGYYWRFANDVNVADPQGTMLELPIYTQMVPLWRMYTAKRVGLQQKAAQSAQGSSKYPQRLSDFLRPRHPLKLDFCRMTIKELITMMDRVIEEDRKATTLFKPIVAIGHTKDLVDFETVENFLSYLKQKGIPVSTFEQVYQKCETAI